MAQLPTRENLQHPAYIKKKKKLPDMQVSRKIQFLTRRKSISKNSPRNERGKGITRKAN